MWIRTWLLIGALLSSLNVSAKEWLIDVRTAEEYSAEHVPGATHIDYQQVVPEVTPERIDMLTRIMALPDAKEVTAEQMANRRAAAALIERNSGNAEDAA